MPAEEAFASEAEDSEFQEVIRRSAEEAAQERQVYPACRLGWDAEGDDLDLQRALQESLKDVPAVDSEDPLSLNETEVGLPRDLSEESLAELIPQEDELTKLLLPPSRSSDQLHFLFDECNGDAFSRSEKNPQDCFRTPYEWTVEEAEGDCCFCCSSEDAGGRKCKCEDADLSDPSALEEAGSREGRALLDAETDLLDEVELKELILLLVGDWQGSGGSEEDLKRWLSHPLVFVGEFRKSSFFERSKASESSESRLVWPASERDSAVENWGLLQLHGGPCGVLAVLQCLLLRALLFTRSRFRRMQRHLSRAASEKERRAPLTLSPCRLLRRHALVEAIASILFQCTDRSNYRLAFLRCQDTDKAGDLRNCIECRVKSFQSIDAVMRFCLKHLDAGFSAEGGALSVLASAVLTRGIETVRSDMDLAAAPLLSVFGHCTQELMNLLTTGAATSGVFDGTKKVDGAFICGALKRPLVGLLAEMEVLRYLEVGALLKTPHFPLWILGRDGHFTTLFALDPAASRWPLKVLAEERAKWAFSLVDETGSWLVPRQGLARIIRALKLRPELEASVPSQDGVVLFSEFLRWYLEKVLLLRDGGSNDASVAEPPDLFYAFLYDGQVSPGPRVRGFLVSPSGALKTAETAGIAPLLRTKWPLASVRELPSLATKSRSDKAVPSSD